MKKIIRNSLSIFTFACCMALAVLFVSSLGSVDAQAADNSQTSAAYNTYMHSLSGKIKVPYMNGYSYGKNMYGKWKTKKKTFDLSKFNYYDMEDINGDGKEELLLSVHENPDAYNRYVLICTMKKDKVVPVFCVGGLRGGLYKATGNRICFLFGGSDCGNRVFLKLKGTSLKRVKSYCYMTNKSVVPYKTTYYMNKKKISYKKYLKGTSGLTSQITFEAIK